MVFEICRYASGRTGVERMIRIIYISTSRVEIVKRELDLILSVSRRNNRNFGVTGLLFAGGRRFLQVLEGPEGAVTQTYDRIKADERHFATVLLSKQFIAERNFADWDMGFQPASALNGPGSVADDVAAMIARIKDPTVYAYFSEFAKRHAA